MGINTDKAPSSRRPAAKNQSDTQTQGDSIPINKLIMNVSYAFVLFVLCETFIVLMSAQIITGMLCKTFTYWLEMGAPGAY